MSTQEKAQQELDIGRLRARWLREDSEEGVTRRDAMLERLQTCCTAGSDTRPTDLDLRGISLVGENLSGLDLTGYDFRDADLSDVDFSESNLSWCLLMGANLYRTKLVESEFLDANLEGANLNECEAGHASFGAANLSGASLVGANFEEATLTHAQMRGTDVRAVNLRGASIRHVDLRNADFTRANLESADLKLSDVRGTIFNLAEMKDARLLRLNNFTQASWIGADITGVDHRGAYLIRRHIWDENFLFEFRSQSKYHNIMYLLWWITSDCGRSIARWGIFVLSVAAFFGIVYQFVDVNYGDHKTAFSPFYFSVVTLTTLGYGDISPISVTAQVIAAVEALLGYIGLGGLLSILSNKIARRAD